MTNTIPRPDPQEDLRVIRETLARTAPSFRPLAPAFFRGGLAWLVLSLLLFATQGMDLLCFLYPGLYEVYPLAGMSFPLYRLPQGAILLLSLVLCLVWQRQKAGLSRLPRLTLTHWQVFLLLALVFQVLSEVAQNQTPLMDQGDGSVLSQIVLYSWVGGWLSYLVFPALPLLLTAFHLEHRPLQAASLLVLVFQLVYLALNLFSQNGSALAFALTVLLTLVQFFLPPAALLATARALKTSPKEG